MSGVPGGRAGAAIDRNIARVSTGEGGLQSRTLGGGAARRGAASRACPACPAGGGGAEPNLGGGEAPKGRRRGRVRRARWLCWSSNRIEIEQKDRIEKYRYRNIARVGNRETGGVEKYR